jgi:hypothetical protein
MPADVGMVGGYFTSFFFAGADRNAQFDLLARKS